MIIVSRAMDMYNYILGENNYRNKCMIYIYYIYDMDRASKKNFR